MSLPLTDVSDSRFPRPDPALVRIQNILSRPRTIAAFAIVALAASGWLALGLLSGFAPASGVANYLTALCRPAAGASLDAGWFALVALMWVAMTLAMMLPSAGPMILTYAEIAETAARKGERIVSPLVLAGGYLIVWLGFAAAAAVLQIGVAWLIRDEIVTQLSVPIAAFLLVGAGLYQFSSLKQACLKVCQRPFQFFFMNWTDRAAGVFKLGIRQGLHCLGCCWAMMLLMLATGAMNIVWMAILALIMVIEKMSRTARFSRAVGAVFVASGAVLAAASIAGFE